MWSSLTRVEITEACPGAKLPNARLFNIKSWVLWKKSANMIFPHCFSLIYTIFVQFRLLSQCTFVPSPRCTGRRGCALALLEKIILQCSGEMIMTYFTFSTGVNRVPFSFCFMCTLYFSFTPTPCIKECEREGLNSFNFYLSWCKK